MELVEVLHEGYDSRILSWNVIPLFIYWAYHLLHAARSAMAAQLMKIIKCSNLSDVITTTYIKLQMNGLVI